MKTFVGWLLENSLRQVLSVPQNPKHHPEGDVFRHTTMVRSSLDTALQLLKQKQAEDPAGPFSNLDFNLTPQEYNIARLGGWLHDIGKSVTTDPVNLTAHGHEDQPNFEKGMEQLGPQWRQMYDKADPQDKADLWFIIQHHMNLNDTDGFASKKLKLAMMDQQGKYLPDRRVKLLLILLVMDRLGRGGTPAVSTTQAKQFAASNVEPGREGIQGMYASSDWMQKNGSRIAPRTNAPAPDDPRMFVAALKQKGKSLDVIRGALKGKFPTMSDQEIDLHLRESSFRSFCEAKDGPASMEASIPLPAPVYVLSKIFKENGFSLYVVGGAVRDFMMSDDGPGYKPKDVDLATNAPPREVERILTKAGVRNFEKGESFGVWVAHVKGEDYEIATFRQDLGYSDGRRPNAVAWASPEEDYKRRDLTINALFYEIPTEPGQPGRIIDHGGGQGFDDIKNKRIRVVGDPFDRFGEDKLRIPRLARFYSRFNDGDVKGTLDDRTLAAIDKFRDLRSHGVTGPRIQQEFLAGLEKSRDTRSYLRNYEALGLLPSVFPGLTLDMPAVERLTDPSVNKNPILVLALLLRQNQSPEKVRSQLNSLNWPNEVTDEVAFLLKSWQTAKAPSPETMSKTALDAARKPDRRNLIGQFGSLVGQEVDQDHWSHLTGYQPPTFTGQEIQQQYGIAPGPEMGRKQRELQAGHYRQSFEDYLKRRGTPGS
jgi:tRNA nucleotidyltransferase/poly(A) polymerase